MLAKFDVGAVVESLIDDAVVVAGADGMSRQVHRARTATTPDDLRRVGADDLVVVTAASLMSGDVGWDQLVGSLVAAEVAE